MTRRACSPLGAQGGRSAKEGVLVRQGLVAAYLLEAVRGRDAAPHLRPSAQLHHSRLQQHLPHAVAGDVEQ